MKFNRQLKNLIEQEVISTEVAEEIVVKEQIRKAGIAWKLMFLISALLVGLGFILIISSNWDVIPDIAKLLGNFAIWGGCLYALYWSFINKKNYIKEALLLISFLFVGATIGLIGQIFNLDGGWSSFAIAWAVLSAVFVILSRLRFTNIIWLVILFSGLNFDVFWRYFFSFFAKNLVSSLFIGVCFCGLLSYAGKSLYKAINGVVVLPKAFADLALFSMYYIGVFTAFYFGNNAFYHRYFNEETFFNWTAIGSNTLAFALLAVRLLLALYHDNIKSFVRNSYIVCAYIICMFLVRMENSFLKGIIFIIGGVFLFGLLLLLQKIAQKINLKGGLKNE